jgi:hypothetical protein
MKKGLIFLILAIFIAGVAFGQERAANVRNNWISGELSIIGAGVRYERMLSQNLSIGADFYFTFIPIVYFIIDEVGMDASVRYYIWGKNFFVGAGLGFHIQEDLMYVRTTGVGITPEVGWKIDVGNEGGFYLQPGVKVPITFGKRFDPFNEIDVEGFATVGFVPYFGMGYSF